MPDHRLERQHQGGRRRDHQCVGGFIGLDVELLLRPRRSRRLGLALFLALPDALQHLHQFGGLGILQVDHLGVAAPLQGRIEVGNYGAQP